MFPLLLTLLAAAPTEGRFVLEVQGVPLAELRVAVKGTTYLYDSVHFLEEGPKTHHVELPLKPGAPKPEVLALLGRPALGCQSVLEERTKTLETLCLTREASPGVLEGTLDGQPFTARYDAAGALVKLQLPGATWSATTKPTRPPAESPFAKGVPVPDGPLTLDPPLPGARWLEHPPLGVGVEGRVGRVRCLVEARAEAARRPRAQVTVGLVVEDGRAYPHAWLTEDGLGLDPSVLPGDPVLARRRYLEVPKEKSGAFYLQLFDGAVRLVPK